MPYALQTVTYVVPARQLITILRAIYLKGAGIEAILFPIVLLVVFGFFVTTVAVMKLKKRLM